MFNTKLYVLVFVLLSLLLSNLAIAQEPYRRGTTTANFLEVGYGARGAAMGDALVASTDDIESTYWNPAGLALMERNEVSFSMQPWIVDINTNYAAVGSALPGLGTFALSFFQMDFGREQVTSLDMQEGTGENYSAADIAFALTFSRRLAQWFSFGASAKYINSTIWHTSANAAAIDLGALVNTKFFSPTAKRADGLTIGMSISNYGTRMHYDGMDLLQTIDPDPSQQGEYNTVEGQFKTQGWELPLIFRIGVALHPIVTANSRLTLEADALHPNNNSESINLGAEYAYRLPSFGSFFLRAGYKGLFMPHSEYGPSFGCGMNWRVKNSAMKLSYAFRNIGILGNVNVYSLSFLF